MPDYLVSKLVEGLNEHSKALRDGRVLVLGVAYKKNVDGMRGSTSVMNMALIQQKSGEVAYSDPIWRSFPQCAAITLIYRVWS